MPLFPPRTVTFANDNDPDEFGQVMPASITERSVDSPLSRKMKARKPKLPARKKFRINYRNLGKRKNLKANADPRQKHRSHRKLRRAEDENANNGINDSEQAINKAKQGTIINGKVVFPKLVSIPEYVRLQKRVYNRDNENGDFQDDDVGDVSPWASNISNYNKGQRGRKRGKTKRQNATERIDDNTAFANKRKVKRRATHSKCLPADTPLIQDNAVQHGKIESQNTKDTQKRGTAITTTDTNSSYSFDYQLNYVERKTSPAKENEWMSSTRVEESETAEKLRRQSSNYKYFAQLSVNKQYDIDDSIKGVLPSSHKPPVPITQIFRKEEDDNSRKLGRIKKDLLRLFKEIDKKTEDLVEIRKRLGTGWNPEPMTQYQSRCLLKKEKLLVHLLAQMHSREDKAESLKLDINNLRKDKNHSKKVLKRYVTGLEAMQKRMKYMVRRVSRIDIEEIKQQIIDVRKIDKREEAEFQEKLFAIRHQGRVAHLENFVQKKGSTKNEVAYTPSNVEVFQKGKFCKYLDEAKIYDQMSDKEREGLKDKISSANWEIMSKIDEAKKREKAKDALQAAWETIQREEKEATFDSMNEFVDEYLKYKNTVYTLVQRLNLASDRNSEVRAQTKRLKLAVLDQEEKNMEKLAEKTKRQASLKKTLQTLDSQVRVHNDEYESSIKQIKIIVPHINKLLHIGLFSDPTSVSDEMLLKNEVDEENVSEVLGSIESRIEGLLLGLEKRNRQRNRRKSQRRQSVSMMIDKRRQSAVVRVNVMPAILDRSDVVPQQHDRRGRRRSAMNFGKISGLSLSPDPGKVSEAEYEKNENVLAKVFGNNSLEVGDADSQIISVGNLRSMVRGKIFKPRDRDIPLSVDVQPTEASPLKGDGPGESDKTDEMGDK